MTKSFRVALAVLALAVIALTAGGCHDSHSTYRLGVSADYHWDDRYDDCRPAYRRDYCPPPRYYRHHH